MKEMIGGLEKTFSEYLNYFADEIYYFNKKYFIPGLVFIGIVGFSLSYTAQPFVKNVVPRIDSYLNQSNNLYYNGKFYGSKKEVEKAKKDDINKENVEENKKREQEHLVELRSIFIDEMEKTDSIKDNKVKACIIEELMDNYEKIRNNN